MPIWPPSSKFNSGLKKIFASPILLHFVGVLSIAILPLLLLDYYYLDETILFVLVSLLFSTFVWLVLYRAANFASIFPDDEKPLPISLGAKIASALDGAFSYDTLDDLVRFRLGRDLADKAGSATDPKWPDKLVSAAQKEGWLAGLVNMALKYHPQDRNLAYVSAQLGLSSVSVDEINAFERIVRKQGHFLEIDNFIATLSNIELRVCRISCLSSKSTTFGTGFLVGPDLVLTNYHVVENVIEQRIRSDQIECLFDYKQSILGAVFEGTTFHVKTDGILKSSKYSQFDVQIALAPNPAPDELDFALLQLAEPIGSEPIGSQGQPTPARGWLALPKEAPKLDVGDPCFILQHPEGGPKKLTIGKMTDVTAGGERRLRYDANTLPGSSGSPCFTDQLELFGLHHAGDSNFNAAFNQAIPLHLVYAEIESLLPR
jgi:V8-like Glu-specific endopeptidase